MEAEHALTAERRFDALKNYRTHAAQLLTILFRGLKVGQMISVILRSHADPVTKERVRCRRSSLKESAGNRLFVAEII